MRIKAIMTSPAITICETAPLLDAMALMGKGGLSGLAVVDESGGLSGILSEGDLLRRIELGTADTDGSWWSHFFSAPDPAEAYKHANGRSVADVMTEHAITIEADDSLSDAARLMEKHHIKRLPVMRDGALVGVLSRADFVDALRRSISPVYEEPATSDREIRTRIMNEVANQRWSSACMIDVSVKDGKVCLAGVVPSEDHRASARIAAENVAGVVSVDDRLSMNTEEYPAFVM